MEMFGGRFGFGGWVERGAKKSCFVWLMCAYTIGDGRVGPVYGVVAMSPHSLERSAWNATKWLWLCLAICLIGWRVSSRVDQYHCSIVSVAHQGQVSFFDANERNRASLDASRSPSRQVAEESDRLLPVVDLEPAVSVFYERSRDHGALLPPIYVDSVSLFSNPPPNLN
jgi:hypothetical protein